MGRWLVSRGRQPQSGKHLDQRPAAAELFLNEEHREGHEQKENEFRAVAGTELITDLTSRPCMFTQSKTYYYICTALINNALWFTRSSGQVNMPRSIPLLQRSMLFSDWYLHFMPWAIQPLLVLHELTGADGVCWWYLKPSGSVLSKDQHALPYHKRLLAFCKHAWRCS